MNYRLPDETLAAIQSFDDSSLLETKGGIDGHFVFTQTLFFAGGNAPSTDEPRLIVVVFRGIGPFWCYEIFMKKMADPAVALNF